MSGVVAVLFGEELLEACDVASVPALVEVPAYDVGNLAQSGFVVAVAAVEGHGADACGVFLLQGILQPAGKGEGTFQYRFQCVAFVLALCYEEDFVHISPRDDAGVVVVLANHLAQVTFAVFRILRCVGHDVYDGNFFPGQHSQLVTHLYDSVVLWIMGNSDEVGAHLFHQPEVAAVHFVGQGYTDRFLVLVAADAAQLVGLAVEEETLGTIEAIPAESGGMLRVVQHLFALGIEERSFHFIYMGCFGRP